MSSSPDRRRLPTWVRVLPYLVVVALVGAVIARNATSRENDQAGISPTTEAPTARVLTFDDATEQGIDADFGPHCDPETGQVTLPIPTAPPCVAVPDTAPTGTTAQGVTPTEVTVATYQTQVNPAMQGMLATMGVSIGGPETRQAIEDYKAIFESVTQTYGRTVRFVELPASGLPTDAVAARNDAIRAAEDLDAFAVIGGPVQTTAFAEELASRGVLCLNCATDPSVALSEELAPHIISPGMAPDQLADHLAAFTASQLAGRPAAHAGDALASQQRSFGLIAVERGGDAGSSSVDVVRDALDARGVELAETVSYQADPATANDQAATNILRLKDAGVTSVLVVADPITLGPLTRAATAQDWYPEWILSGALLADSTFLSRTYDQAQWAHAFGISTRALPTGQPDDPNPASQLYEWYYGTPPPVDDLQAATIVGGLSLLYSALTLAGPDLTTDAFRDGLFHLNAPSNDATQPAISYGRHVWPYDDYFGIDDATVIWWDPQAESADEQGRSGQGSYRFVNDGRRYLPTEWPSESLETSPDDPLRVPSDTGTTRDYPPPPGAPTAD